MELGLIALVVLFQLELRRLLERMGRSFPPETARHHPRDGGRHRPDRAGLYDMSASHTGALVIFRAESEQLNSVMATGTVINSDVSAELIKNLFYNKAPLHDGAVVVREGRIAAAGCVLPLTQSTNLSKELGMRHRAGIGLSEQSDAVVVIVSEETGAISVAVEGMLKRHLTAASLDRLLHSELIREEEDQSRVSKVLRNLQNSIRGKRNEKNEKNN